MASERIIVVSGPLEGTSVEVLGTLTVGRSRENGLQVNDLQVSRRHALIQQTPSGTIIRDLGSGNGTYVGQRRVLEYKLSDGDIITIGPAEMRFEVVAPRESSQKAPDKSVVFRAAEDKTLQASAASKVYQTFVESATRTATTELLREAQSRLAAVYEATQIISSERDINKLLARVMDQLFHLVPAHNGVILLKDSKTGELRKEYVTTGSGQSEVTISSSIVRKAFELAEAVITYDAAVDDRFGAGMSIIAQNITSAMCAPLEHQGETLGVLYVDTRGTTSAFTQSELELMVALGRTAAIAIKNAQYLAKVEKGYHDTLIVLSNAIEMRDHYTVGHTWRVTHFAVEIAKKLGWSEEKLQECEKGGILHDVGKIAIEDAILRKTDKLTEDEYAKMKIHPERGARMMQDVEHLIPLIPYALYHHERWDGRGYPFELAGEDIPIEGRVVAVADTYDAMTSNRPYRKGLDPEVAIGEIIKGKGIQFDPMCADALVACHKEGTIARVRQNFYEKDGGCVVCPFCSTYVRIPEKTKPESEITCNVCHRRILLKVKNEAYYGEVVPETEPQALPPTHSGSRSTQANQVKK